jgi:hypothetical protein
MTVGVHSCDAFTTPSCTLCAGRSFDVVVEGLRVDGRPDESGTPRVQRIAEGWGLQRKGKATGHCHLTLQLDSFRDAPW